MADQQKSQPNDRKGWWKYDFYDYVKSDFVNQNEGYSLDWIKMTEWIWPKLVNMTENLTTTNINMVNLTENILNITTTTTSLRFVVVNFFRSNSNQFLAISIRSSELASPKLGHFHLTKAHNI